MADTRTQILVKRYTPEKSAPFYQTYELRFHERGLGLVGSQAELKKGRGASPSAARRASGGNLGFPRNEPLTVLDALNILKDEQDGSLTFRWSCRMGICGSCSAVVNGKPVLMCQTYLRDLKWPVQIEPLRNFPVIKDLVVEIDDVFEKMRGTMPYMTRMKERALQDGEYEQTPAQLEKLKQTSQCIKCMLCYSACPVYGLDKNFMGPAAGALAYRYNADSRDETKGERMDRVSGKNGVWKCSFVGECSVVCPKRVDPALALQRLKIMGALRISKML